MLITINESSPQPAQPSSGWPIVFALLIGLVLGAVTAAALYSQPTAQRPSVTTGVPMIPDPATPPQIPDR